MYSLYTVASNDTCSTVPLDNSKHLLSVTEIRYLTAEFCYSASLVNFEGQYINSFNQHSDDNDDDYDDGDVHG